MSRDANGRLNLRNRKVSQPNGHAAAHALFGSHVRSHPLKRGRATSIQSHPLAFVPVHADWHPHPTRTQLKRQGFFGFYVLLRFQQPNLLRVEIDLHYSASKEVRPHESVHGPFTRTA